ncbi:hypothetical protein [Streptomyces sp. FH025]|uniref:hypothetical protein n=1 Tax=Streptomyces sp. FH025 TaxID=2815937 RepID=UPI001A9DD98A|nr:hypothetical protein [Streptomyces sp. FH025]MBO1413214.1 hypothetical protein [Streptomyces sp. FH025]
MTDGPTPEQLDRLLSTADRRRLTPAEAALLRTGVQHLRKAAAGPRPATSDTPHPTK